MFLSRVLLVFVPYLVWIFISRGLFRSFSIILIFLFLLFSHFSFAQESGNGPIADGTTSSGSNESVVSSIVVSGNQRVDSDTIRSYVTVDPGIPYSDFDTDESLKALYATGLFSDVSITEDSDRLVVKVVENPTVNLVSFDGNDKVADEVLQSVIQLESLGVFDEGKLSSDEQRVQEAMRRSGRSEAVVSSRVVKLDDNRVDVIFEIDEGGRTSITSIEFEGNESFSSRTLRDILIHREKNLLSWLRRDDVFDEERLEADEERIRQYYFTRGFADFRIVDSQAELDTETNTYSIFIKLDEGIRYKFGEIRVDSSLDIATSEVLEDELDIETGDVYNAQDVDRTLEHLTEFIARTGYAFAEVTPRGERNESAQTIDLTFFVDEGPRVYIERIEITGNERSRDYIVRREFDISEGDPYNTVLINRSKNRLDALGYFGSVNITTREGSAPDRIIVQVAVTDRATGELSIGAGYSTASGILGEVSLSEGNFLGRGHEIRLTGGFGADNQRYEVSFTEPYFMGNRVAAGFDISTEITEADHGLLFDTNSSLLRLRAAFELGEQVTLTTNYSYQFDRLNLPTTVSAGTVSPATLDSVGRSPFVVSSVGYDLEFSDLDDVNNPRDGLRAEIDQDIAGLGGDASYLRTTGRVKGYWLLSEESDLVFTSSLGLGVIEPLNDDLRIVDHFFQGGETTRGFSTNGFGPRAATGEPVGGAKYANASIELEFPFPVVSRNLGLRGAFFLDAGTLWDNKFNDSRSSSQLTTGDVLTNNLSGNFTRIDDEANIRASSGLSIIWDSPFGPLRGDFTRVLTEEEGDDIQTFRFGINSRF